MPNFKQGPVESPGYGEEANQFSQVTEFTNDVYIYGKLYADINASDVFSDATVEFNDVVIKKNLFVSGVSTFIEAVDMNYLTVFHRHNVGAAGTVFVAISSTSDADGQVGGRVGVGTTQPAGQFQVGSDCFIVTEDPCAVGVGNTQPSQKFQVGIGTRSLVVTGVGTLGVGVTEPGSFGINNAIHGELKADFDGSIRVARNIYDSSGSPGQNGFFMNRDANGIRWVSFTPVETEGVFLQNDGVFVPSVGAAQSFTVLNFQQFNSFGSGTDSVVATAQDPTSTTGLATIFTSSFWGFDGSDNIYRMTKVGINNQSPSFQLDVSGDFRATSNAEIGGTLDVTGSTTLNSTLQVDSDTELDGKLDVDGLTTFNDVTDATSITNASVQIDGGVGIVKKLFVGGQTKVDDATQSTNTVTGALIVSGGTGIVKDVNIGGNTVVGGRLDVNSVVDSSNTSTGALVVDGGAGIDKNINVGGSGVIAGRLDVDSDQQSTSTATGALVVDGGVGIAKNLNVGQDAKIVGNLELDARILDFFNNNGVGICKTDYRLSSFDVSGVGVGVSWRPSGVQTKRTIWVTKNGCDTNSGLLEGDAKYTIGAAAGVAQEGDTIRVRSGTYFEENPIGLRDDVAINGEDLRLVLLIPKNKNKDFFHVRRGCLIENLSFTGASISDDHTSCAAVAFPPTQTDIDAGLEFQAVKGFTAVGPADEGSSGRWRSPYIRNCTNFMTKSIGMKINGDHANADSSGSNNLGQDLKSMVCDSFTQYNEMGIGVSLTNNAYAQLVSIFTIGCDIAIFAGTGGQCDLTNSNSSFGNFGLYSDGVGDVEFIATTDTTTIAGQDTFVLNGVRDVALNPRKPFDGQGGYFHINMDDYPDSPASGIVTQPLNFIRSLDVVDGGTGYNEGAPPNVTIQAPQGPEAILPEFSANVSAAGSISSIDVIASGRNFLPDQELTVTFSSGNATATVNTDPILFTVDTATDVTSSGLSTVTFNEFIPYNVGAAVTTEFVRLSRIITSSHSFEYVGAGTDLNKANPFQGGEPIPENEIVAINGGQVPFTSTDQKGNFRIGDGLTIDQTTSTIRGRDFNRAIQAQLTPLILALR